MNWKARIDEHELERVKTHLGIRSPVEVEDIPESGDSCPCGNGCPVEDGLRGRHAFRDGRHLIQVRAGLDARRANMTLLHELKHAAQNEELGHEKATVLYNVAELLYGYTDNPFEQDAEDFAHEHARDFGLVAA